MLKGMLPQIRAGTPLFAYFLIRIFLYQLAFYSSRGKTADQILFNAHKEDYNRNNRE